MDELSNKQKALIFLSSLDMRKVVLSSIVNEIVPNFYGTVLDPRKWDFYIDNRHIVDDENRALFFIVDHEDQSNPILIGYSKIFDPKDMVKSLEEIIEKMEK